MRSSDIILSYDLQFTIYGGAGIMPNHFVITVHGIRTFGAWQERLEALVRPVDPSIAFKHYKYGYFSVLAFLVPFLRSLVTNRFARDFSAFASQNPGARIDIVAHSFGTYIAAHALKKLKSNTPLVHTLILSGSVLKTNFPWYKLLTQTQIVGRVINDCGTKDLVLVLTLIVVLGSGMAGRIGFIGFHDNTKLIDRYHAIGHRGYFCHNGRVSDDFMKTFWLPLLTRDTLASPGQIQRSRFTTFLVNNAEPLKLLLFASPFIILILVYSHLFEQARRDADLARQQTIIARQQTTLAENQTRIADRERSLALAHQLIAESDLLRNTNGDWTIASLLAIESMLRQPLLQNDIAVRQQARLLPKCVSLQMAAPIDRAEYSPNGMYLAVSCERHHVSLFDPANGAQLYQLNCGGAIASAFTRDSHYLAVVGRDNSLSLVDIYAKHLVRRRIDFGRVYGAVFSEDAQYVAIWVNATLDSYSADQILVFDSISQRQLSQLHRQSPDSAGQEYRFFMAIFPYNPRNPLAFSPDNKHIALGHLNGISIFNVTTGNNEFEFNPSPHSLTGDQVAFIQSPVFASSALNDCLISAGSDGIIGLLAPRKYEPPSVPIIVRHLLPFNLM
jgi:pimeloyl-ACP methyl ester carboxylesterase